MIIRNSKVKDLDFCAELDAKTFKENKSVMLEEMKKKFEDKDYTTLIIEEQNRPIGFCTFVNRKWNNTIYIELFILEEGFRDRGTGTKIIDRIVEISKKKKIRRIFCDVGIDNFGAINFYLKNGFSLSGFTKDFFDERKDVVLLSCFVK